MRNKTCTLFVCVARETLRVSLAPQTNKEHVLFLSYNKILLFFFVFLVVVFFSVEFHTSLRNVLWNSTEKKWTSATCLARIDNSTCNQYIRYLTHSSCRCNTINCVTTTPTLCGTLVVYWLHILLSMPPRKKCLYFFKKAKPKLATSFIRLKPRVFVAKSTTSYNLKPISSTSW